MLDIPHEWIHLDILAGDTGTLSFLQKNPNGKIPLLELDDGRCLSESNAILNYLAHGTELLTASTTAILNRLNMLIENWLKFTTDFSRLFKGPVGTLKALTVLCKTKVVTI
ncbi:MAG: hypothetical protein SwBeaBPW_09600 [Shewanella algae]